MKYLSTEKFQYIGIKIKKIEEGKKTNIMCQEKLVFSMENKLSRSNLKESFVNICSLKKEKKEQRNLKHDCTEKC